MNPPASLRSLGIALGLLTSSSPPPASAETPLAPAPLATHPTLAEALAKAKGDGRLVFLQFKSSKCPHCRVFQEQVMDREAFRELATAKLHLVIYDLASDDLLSPAQLEEMKALMVEHSVRYTPTLLVFSRDGAELLKIEGYRDGAAAEFMAQLAAVPGPPPP